MEIGVAAFRAELKRWLDAVNAGEEIIITDRGIAVARLTGIDVTPILQQLECEGVVRLPRSTTRPKATRPKATGQKRIPAKRPVSGLVSEQRD